MSEEEEKLRKWAEQGHIQKSVDVMRSEVINDLTRPKEEVPKTFTTILPKRTASSELNR